MVRHVPFLLGLILLLSGCMLTLESLALIPTSEPVHIPPRYAQYLNVLKYVDLAPFQYVNEHGEN